MLGLIRTGLIRFENTETNHSREFILIRQRGRHLIVKTGEVRFTIATHILEQLCRTKSNQVDRYC